MPSGSLPSNWFQILLSLADESRHGLGITKDVHERTGSTLQLWPGMLYGALRKMEAAGLVEEIDPPAGFASGGGRPRFHRITRAGRRACAEEAERLAGYVNVARERRVLGRKA